MAQGLLGAGRGLSHIASALSGEPTSAETSAEASAAKAFEEQLHGSLPSELTKLVLQLARERDAFVVRTVLAAGLPGWEDVTLADVVVSPISTSWGSGCHGIVKIVARTATSNAKCVFKIPSQTASGCARVRAVHQALSDAGVAATLLASGADWTVEPLLTTREVFVGEDWEPE